MCAAQEQNDNGQLLTRYLLGGLTADEQDRLGDLSITDDEFALRLRSAENELVDAYARGELSGEIVHRFRTVYSDPATNLLLWRSSPLEIQTGAKGKSVLLTLPAQILKEQNYALELYGIPANASPVFVSTYSFHVVFR